MNWTTWLIWMLLPFVLVLFAFSPLCPLLTRNHDGNRLLIWCGRRWIEDGDKWVEVTN